MAFGYTRQSSGAIVSGQPIHAADLNAEFNQLQTAFDNLVGHDHSLGTGVGKQLILTGASGIFTPINITGTSSTTPVMMGIGSTVTITPTKSGVVIATVMGNIQNNTASDGASIILRYNTGSAPANGAAATGNSVGVAVNFNNGGSASFVAPFNLTALLKPPTLSVGSTYWIDVALGAITGGTASISNVTVSLWEI